MHRLTEMNHPRSAKKTANRRIRRAVETLGGVQHEKRSDRRAAGTSSQHTQIDQVCCWRLGEHKICGIPIRSQDHFMQHLSDIHCGGFSALNGYFCDWKGCVEGKNMRYNTKDALQEHAKNHFNVSAVAGDDDTEYKVDEGHDGVADDTDSDYCATSDEEYPTRKRRRSKPGTKPRPKKKRSSGAELQVTQRAASNHTPATPAVPQMLPAHSLIYGFKCMWIVHHSGKPMKCSRKLMSLEESLDHLLSFHVSKTIEWKLPLKCTWEDCPENKEFATAEDLRDHVKVHAESARPPPPRIATLGDVRAAKQAVQQQPGGDMVQVADASGMSKSLVASKPVGEVLPILSARPASPACEPFLKKPECEPGESFTESTHSQQDSSWISSVLHALMCTKLNGKNDATCTAHTSCHYCRFVALNNELSEDLCLSRALLEFISFQTKLQDFKGHGDPLTFITAFCDSIINDESRYHGSSTFKDTLWMRYIESDVPMCLEHPLNGNIVNLFPVQYKSCVDCCKQTLHWPTELQESLIIKLKAADDIRYPEVISVKGRVFLLSAVVTAENESAGDAYSAYVRIGESWSWRYQGSVETVASVEEFNKKMACIVIYKEKVNTLDDEYPIVAQKMLGWSGADGDFHNGSFLDIKKEDPVSEGTASNDFPSSSNLCKYPSEYEIRECETKPTQSETSDSTVPEKLAGRLASAFMHRRIQNHSNESCITSVLQVLLQTTLAHVPVEMCRGTSKCYLCNLVSFSRRMLLDRNGEPIPAYEFTLCKEVFGITTGEGDPGTYIGDVIGAVVESAKTNHNVSFPKYNFMIMLQKKSCNCRSSIETYYWKVTPEKRNESLMDLLVNYRTLCTSCNIMADVQPVQMPDNLVITVERNRRNLQASVQFPDEWGCYDSRYFLSALIVREMQAQGEDDHFIAYCKIFGEWFRYNDGDVTGASFSELLDRQVCVLVYVTKELTMNDLNSILTDTQVYTFKAWNPTSLQLKQEPVD